MTEDTKPAIAKRPPTRAHIVLGSGGVKTLAYVDALDAFAEAGIEFASISACSAGSLVGAPTAAVRSRVEAVELRRLPRSVTDRRDPAGQAGRDAAHRRGDIDPARSA